MARASARSAAALGLAALAAAALAGEQATKPPRTGPPVREVRQDDFVVEVLANGTCLAVRRAPTAGVVAIQFWVGAGSTTEGRLAGAGASHFVEHMLFEGTVREPGRGFDLLVRSLGGVHNGYTSLEETVYHVTVPGDGWTRALPALVELVRSPALPREVFERERAVILQELREGEDDVERMAGRLLAETVWRVHPYRFRVGGDIESFSKLTYDDIVEHYRRMYVPGNELVVLAGDLDVGAAAAAARELLSKAERGPLPDLSRPAEPEQLAPREAVRRTPRAEKARVQFAWRTVELLHPDLYALDALAAILGEGRSSRLYRRLKEEEGLALSAGAYSWTPRDPGYLVVWAECEDSRVGELRAAVAREVARVREEKVSDEELSRVRAMLEAEHLFRRQTAEGVARELASDLFFTGDPEFSEKYLAGIRAVTASDVLEAAQRYLVDARLTVAILRPERREGAAEPRPGPALASSGARGEPLLRELKGGGRLVLLRDDSLPVVSVCAALLAGLRLEPEGKEGISAVLAQLLPKGTRRRSGEELARAIEGRGGSFRALSGRNSLSVQVEALSSELPRALEVAAEMLAMPALDPGELEKVRAEALAAIRARSERPWAAARELLAAELFRGHPYRFPETGTPESVGALARRDVAEFHRRIAVRGNLVVSICGSFDPEAALALAEKAFRVLPGGAFRDIGLPPAEPPRKGTRLERELRGSRSSVVLWGFPGARLGAPEADALELAAEVLGGMSGRLWTAVRGEEGLAYAVGAFSDAQLDPGMFALYVATRPELEARALEVMRRELERLLAEPPRGEELARAKASLAGEDALALQERSAVALRTALYERYGLGAKAALELRRRLEAIGPEEIAAAARRYLDPSGGVIAVACPPKRKD